jgi:hypothetical protein
MLYGVALVLRRREVLAEEYALILSSVVIALCLPAMIFVPLAGKPVYLRQLAPGSVDVGSRAR